MEIRALQESDDWTEFRSGDADLDRFLYKYAGQNQFRHHIGTTYVALELARLAVDKSMRGRGLGKHLLRFVLHLSVRMAADFGCTGVVVDAKPMAVSFYEQFGFAALEVTEGQSQAKPPATAMFLPLREIAAALK